MIKQQEMQEATASTLDNALAKTPGQWLQNAREQAGLTAQQVAEGLRLDVRLIAAIEVNRFKDLGAPVYAKGYLRKYARMVGLPEETVLQRYESYGDVAVLADPIPKATGSIQQPTKLLPNWALWAVLAMVAIAVAITLSQLRSDNVVTNTVMSVTSQSAAGVGVPTSSPLEISSQEQPLTMSAAPVATAVAVPDDAAATQPGTQIALQLKFSGGDSWVEVYDAADHQVLYDLGRNASERQVNVVPPLRVVFGSAANVSVQINGRDVSVPANRVEANVAHFAINAAGSIE
jgi:cytoskeleton protein RodZ